MNRLWVRLSLSFSAIILSGVTVIMAFVMGGGSFPDIIRTGIARTLTENDGVIEQISMTYAESEDWDEVIEIVNELRDNYRMIGFPIEFNLITSDGDTLYVTDSSASFITDFENDDIRMPITVGDVTIAYMQIDLFTPSRSLTNELSENSTLQATILSEIQRVILTTILMSAVIGIIAGTIVSRYLTTPLGYLATAARTIRDKKSYQKVVIMDSTSEINEVAQAFNEMLDALDHAEQLRRNLVADVAHELRTPLSVLQGNIYAILDDVYPANKEQVSRLYDQTRILSRLVSDLHEISQAEANQLTLHLSLTNIELILEDITDTFELVALSKGISLKSDIQGTLPSLMVDSIRIEQVLNNLINNAIIHTPEGGKITVRAFIDSENLNIQVQDTGKGIPSEHLDNIFERFYRLDPNRTRSEGGTGLGLAIVKAIVTIHNGTVSASSTGIVGEGTKFTVKLPIQHNL